MRRIFNAWILPNTLLRQPWWALRILDSFVRLYGSLDFGPEAKCITVRRNPTPPKMVVKWLRAMVLRKLKRFKIYPHQSVQLNQYTSVPFR